MFDMFSLLYSKSIFTKVKLLEMMTITWGRFYNWITSTENRF